MSLELLERDKRIARRRRRGRTWTTSPRASGRHGRVQSSASTSNRCALLVLPTLRRHCICGRGEKEQQNDSVLLGSQIVDLPQARNWGRLRSRERHERLGERVRQTCWCGLTLCCRSARATASGATPCVKSLTPLSARPHDSAGFRRIPPGNLRSHLNWAHSTHPESKPHQRRNARETRDAGGSTFRVRGTAADFPEVGYMELAPKSIAQHFAPYYREAKGEGRAWAKCA